MEDFYIDDTILHNLKIKLSIADNDDSEDELLRVLFNDAYSYMMIYFDGDIPEELQFVMENVTVKRYRRLGAEGIAVEKIDVLSTTYESGDDFAEYLPIMKRYKDNKSGLGFRFI